MDRLTDPIALLHPVPVVACPTPGSNLVRTFVARQTPVRLAERDPGAFGEVRALRMPFTDVVDRFREGPGGLWRVIGGPGGTPVPLAAFRRWLSGGGVPTPVKEAIQAAVSGTPLAAFGLGTNPDQDWVFPAFRGHRDVGRIVSEDDAAGSVLADWVAAEIALVDGAALARYRPLANLQPLHDTSWGVATARYGAAIDTVFATPRTYEAAHAAWARHGRRAVRGASAAWRGLEAAWPEGGDEDVRFLLNQHAGRLRQRIDRRVEAIRTRCPGHDARGELETLQPGLAGMAHRACLGLAGSPGHEGDLDLFRRAVALETAVAGKMAHRTGIQVLHRHLVEVVGARTLALPAEDAAALDALSPGA